MKITFNAVKARAEELGLVLKYNDNPVYPYRLVCENGESSFDNQYSTLQEVEVDLIACTTG